ncbi:DUF1226-domain-containing protein [Backusella circina FSU 941]|nr:DUF1226-domain-containing protein [Backusella circina FSU 941]
MPPKSSSESEDNSDITDSLDNFQVVPSNDEEQDMPPLPEEEEEEPAKPGIFLPWLFKTIKFLLMPLFKIIFAPTAQRAVVKTAMMGMTISWILMTSLVAYVTFYRYYVPPIAHVHPIWFQYASRETLVGPHAWMDLSTMMPPLRHEQTYDVSIQLHVPTSNINFDIGNFMVDLKLQTSNGTTIVESSRPTILRYQSQMQRVIRVFTNVLPLLVGVADESQKLRIKLVEDYMESKHHPISQVAISISDPNIQIYDAKLQIIASFRGLRYYMYFYYISTGFTFVTSFAIIEFIFAAIAWKVFGEGLWHQLQMMVDTTEENDSTTTTTPLIPDEDSSEKESD